MTSQRSKLADRYTSFKCLFVFGLCFYCFLCIFLSYKWCVVPQCSKTSIKTPEKLFIHVPTAEKERKKWLELALRDPTALSNTSSLYICEDHFDVFYNEFMRFPHFWIIFGSINYFLKSNIYIPINSKVLTIEKYDEHFKINTLYKVTPTHGFTISHVADWSENKGFSSFNDVIITTNRSNLQKAQLRASYVLSDDNSIKHLSDNRNKDRDKLTKINYLLYESMCELYNMTHVVFKTKEWGLELDPVTKKFYKGMMFDLTSDKADIAGTVSFIPKERLKYFKFMAATTKESIIKFVFRAPPLPYSSNIFLMTFDRYVWYAFVTVMICCCICIRLLVKWEAQETSFSEKFQENQENVPNFLDIFIMQLAAICQMDFYYEPKSLSGKIATFTLMLSCAYIYTAFSARIVLLLQSSDNNLVDVSSLYNAKMDMAAEDNSYNQFFFKYPNPRTNEEWRKLIYENRMLAKNSKANPFITAERGMFLVQNSYFAFNIEITTANYFIEKMFSQVQKCSVRSVDTIFKGDVPHINCRRNSTFIKFYLVAFRKFFENGIHQREYQRIFTKHIKCQGLGQNFFSVGIIECYFPFLIFAVGVTLSFFILTAEIFLKKYLVLRVRTK